MGEVLRRKSSANEEQSHQSKNGKNRNGKKGRENRSKKDCRGGRKKGGIDGLEKAQARIAKNKAKSDSKSTRNEKGKKELLIEDIVRAPANP